MSSYYLPREDLSWEADAERAADLIREDISEYLRTGADRPVFVEWLDYDGLDEVGSPIEIPTELSDGQREAHTAAVEALLAFLDCLDISDDALEKRVEKMRGDADWDAYDAYRADRKAG